MRLRDPASALLLLLLSSTSCTDIPKPSAQEISARDTWAAAVSPAARQQVMDEAAHHTAWSEKRRIRYEIDRFQHVYKQEQARKGHMGGGTTNPATRPATRPARQET